MHLQSIPELPKQPDTNPKRSAGHGSRVLRFYFNHRHLLWCSNHFYAIIIAGVLNLKVVISLPNHIQVHNRIMYMSDSLRRFYNTVDLLFDTHAISQESRYSRSGGASRLQRTALDTMNTILPFAFRLERQA